MRTELGERLRSFRWWLVAAVAALVLLAAVYAASGRYHAVINRSGVVFVVDRFTGSVKACEPRRCWDVPIDAPRAAEVRASEQPPLTMLGAIRRQYPQYVVLTDTELADRLYTRFYSGMPRGEFDAWLAAPAPGQRALSDEEAMHFGEPAAKPAPEAGGGAR